MSKKWTPRQQKKFIARMNNKFYRKMGLDKKARVL